MLEKEEKLRTLIRGESLSSSHGNSLRSILKRVRPPPFPPVSAVPVAASAR